MLRRVSSAACFIVLLAGAATCAPSAADAAVVCQNDKRPNRFKIRVECKPGKETVVGEIGAPGDPTPPSPVTPPADPAPTATSNTRIFGARKIAATEIMPNESVWLDFGTPRTYEPEPPPEITAVAAGQLPSFRFSTVGTSDLVVTFSAQCMMISDVQAIGLRIQFRLDGLPFDGALDRPVLCSSHAIPHWGAVHVSYVIRDVPAGIHEIQAFAGHTTSFAGTGGYLARTDLTIIASEQ
ncbi:MAG: hypothetical protein OEP95_05060 [Myxococcales bacterium]|nr:hypothetical protein [Myxococcales bacterium]